MKKSIRPRTLSLRPIQSLRDFQCVRHIRNNCRHFMTNDTRKINVVEQAIYWLKQKVDRFTIIFLGYDECEKPIAFGVIHYDDMLAPWVTGGILRHYRGMGYGRQLFQQLCDNAHGPVNLEVWASNKPAHSLYQTLGFHELSRRPKGTDEVIIMRAEPKQWP